MGGAQRLGHRGGGGTLVLKQNGALGLRAGNQLDSGIAVHSTNMQTNTEQFQIIHAQQFCNQWKWCA